MSAAFPRGRRPYRNSPILVAARRPLVGVRSVAEAPYPSASRITRLTPPQTSDLVKRRYSTRFANGPPPGFDPGVPPMPNVAAFEKQVQSRGRERNYSRERSRSTGRGDRDRDASRRPPPSRGGGGPPTIDMKALRDPNLNADQCPSPTISSRRLCFEPY